MPIISYPSPRVSQLDAHILDSELMGLLKQQLIEIFDNHGSSWWTYTSNPEIWTLLLNLLVFRLTIWKSGTSYGLQLQNLKLSNFKSGKIISHNTRFLLMGLLIGDYLYNRLQSYLYATDINEGQINGGIINKIKNFVIKHKDIILNKLNNTLKLASSINFILFLLNGNYPSLTHRILGISLTPIASELLKFTGNNVNFEFQNRQLVWNVMTEFLVFILPFMKLKAMRRMANKLVPNKQEKPIVYQHVPESQCAVCIVQNRPNVTVTNPYVTNCGHTYCYVCIATRFNAIANDGDDYCLKCGEKLLWFKEWDNVDESAITVQYEEVIETTDDELGQESNYEESDDDDQRNQSVSTSDSDDYSEGEELDEEMFEL